MSDAIVRIEGLKKAYANGVEALKGVDLDIRKGEILALLGPNGAGKTTLINIVCGIVTATGGQVLVDGKNWIADFRNARTRIGLVPQELTTDAFESVWATVSFSRGLFGKPRNDAKVEEILKRLTLWDKRKSEMRELSGGMKRRVMIAKALAHEPDILFLDEPTAGVDVELRRDMWELVRKLRADGTTIILTTHYIEEAEEMADRVGVIRKGELVALGDRDVSRLALTYAAEMGGLANDLEKFVRRWPSSAVIASNFAEFADAARDMVLALAVRIERENRFLYPLIEAAEVAAS
jgi:ABC-2 type transport system ATP-binding protein